MDDNLITRLRDKTKLNKRGICQRCKTNPSTARIQVRADEKKGDSTEGQNQKFKLIASKSVTLCDACCADVFEPVIDLIDKMV